MWTPGLQANSFVHQLILSANFFFIFFLQRKSFKKFKMWFLKKQTKWVFRSKSRRDIPSFLAFDSFPAFSPSIPMFYFFLFSSRSASQTSFRGDFEALLSAAAASSGGGGGPSFLGRGRGNRGSRGGGGGGGRDAFARGSSAPHRSLLHSLSLGASPNRLAELGRGGGGGHDELFQGMSMESGLDGSGLMEDESSSLQESGKLQISTRNNNNNKNAKKPYAGKN